MSKERASKISKSPPFSFSVHGDAWRRKIKPTLRAGMPNATAAATRRQRTRTLSESRGSSLEIIAQIASLRQIRDPSAPTIANRPSAGPVVRQNSSPP